MRGSGGTGPPYPHLFRSIAPATAEASRTTWHEAMHARTHAHNANASVLGIYFPVMGVVLQSNHYLQLPICLQLFMFHGLTVYVSIYLWMLFVFMLSDCCDVFALRYHLDHVLCYNVHHTPDVIYSLVVLLWAKPNSL